MIENRKFIRLKAPLPIEYRLLKKNANKKLITSQMRDISVGGLSLVVLEPMRMGELIEVVIQAPHLEHPLKVIGDAMWCETLSGEKAGAYLVGVRFQEVNADHLNQILDYVYTVAIG